MALTISDAAAAAILIAADVDPADFDAGTMTIDFIPAAGACTVRATRILSIDASTVRAALRVEFADPTEED